MRMEKGWRNCLEKELELPYIKKLKYFLEKEDATQTVFPPTADRFQAFLKTPFEKVKVVIVGQDPYHGDGQAHGLSFSVPKHVQKIPPSLQNIFKELKADLQIPIPSTGCLIPWAEQGVFLLNATLTVRKSEPKSHYGRGWETFTDAVIQALAERETPMVFMLWGQSAKDKGEKILSSKTNHLVLTSAHPSPFSATKFFGCRHFSKANEFLVQNGRTPIQWDLSLK